MAEGEQGKVNPTQEESQVKTEAKTETEAPKTVTYTQEDVSKMQSSFEKKWRDAEKKAEVADSGYTEASQHIEQLTGRINQLQDGIDSRDLAAIGDDAEGRRAFDIRKQARLEMQDLDKQRQQFKKDKAEAIEGLKFRDAYELSKQFGIDVDELMACKSYDEMKDKIIESLKEAKEAPKKEAESEAVLPEHIDSGAQSGTGGAGRTWKASEIQNMDSSERVKNAHEINKATTEGRILWNE